MALVLSVFYLLLLALAEHLGFALAYWLAAAALCAMLLTRKIDWYGDVARNGE